ncbi:MAG TPA: hypothetical protein PKH24_08790 [Sedimentisphaerales bacterium]|jgi:hypothetical protein|nr:hypothetical protein [Sedimentisphaerales bacterium]HNU28860.1 hypothetical protein [Sedimentisphaerales bacterium]
MEAFIQKYRKDVTGVLSGWDRVRMRGMQRILANVGGMMSYLSHVGVWLKDFGAFVERTCLAVRQASEQAARRLDRPVLYLSSSAVDKYEQAQTIAEQDRVQEGLVCVFSCVEPCQSYKVQSDRASKTISLQKALRKCVHLYHYWRHKDFGLMHARLQTWFPFTIEVCFNGRSWLARQMDKQGLGYTQRDNCFSWLEDVSASQKLMEELRRFRWPAFLRSIAEQVHPLQKDILRGFRTEYYWSMTESEWATDVMFDSPQALARVYPSFVEGALTTFASPDVMRFLGKKPSGPFKGEIVSSYLRRPEGVRVKHSVQGNSVKMYDKQGNLLRIETTMNDPYSFKAYRPKENDPEGPQQWRYLRKGVADTQRRAEICQGVNDRYLEALASLDSEVPLKQLVASVCRPTRWKRRPVRALQPWSVLDQELLEVVGRGEYTLQGFRNRDVVAHLYPQACRTREERHRAGARVTRLLRLLRAHGLVRKISGTRRYRLTAKGRDVDSRPTGFPLAFRRA